MKRLRYLFALLIALATLAPALRAQENKNVQWKLLTPTLSGKPGEVVSVKVQATIAAGSHMYSLKAYASDIAPQTTEVTVGESNVVKLGGKIGTSKRPISHVDENFDSLETEYWEGTVVFTVPVKIAKDAKGPEASGWVNFYFMSCDATSCQPPTDAKLSYTIAIAADSATASTTSAADSAQAVAAITDTSASTTTTGPDTAAATGSHAEIAPGGTVKQPADKDFGSLGGTEDIAAAEKKGLGAYLWLAASMGALALLTPCVFPMIPITISFFTKRKQTTRRRSIRDAGLYSLGIILTFTGIGFVFALLFGATGIQDFAANPIVNIAMAGIFVLLALNLFGLFEIQVPSVILNRLNRKAQQDGDSVTGVMLMGLVFALTSFTCTVPFVGGVMAQAATTGEWLWPMFGTAAFATVFSAPFFLLALFPAALKSMPKSGGWLNSVKVVMGFLEVAFAMKFLSNTDLVWEWGIFTRELFVAIWVAIAVLITFYLLGRFHLPHDSHVEKVGPVRVMFAIGFLSISLWLMTGLFGGQLGDLEAYMPPQEYPGKGNTSPLANVTQSAATAPGPAASGTTAGGHEGWLQDDYQKALAVSRETGKPVFIDFTGYICGNCRWMEKNMFPRADVSELMKSYVLVRLYTDRRDPVNKQNREMQLRRFKTIALPFYAIVSSADSVISTFPGFTREPEQFVQFLRKGVSTDQPLAAR